MDQLSRGMAENKHICTTWFCVLWRSERYSYAKCKQLLLFVLFFLVISFLKLRIMAQSIFGFFNE